MGQETTSPQESQKVNLLLDTHILLWWLADDARLTPAQMAERTGRPEQEVKSAIEQLEREGVIGSVHDYFYSTVGAGAPVHRSRAFGQEIAAELRAGGGEKAAQLYLRVAQAGVLQVAVQSALASRASYHAALAGRELADKGVVNRVLAVRDALHIKVWPGHH